MDSVLSFVSFGGSLKCCGGSLGSRARVCHRNGVWGSGRGRVVGIGTWRRRGRKSAGLDRLTVVGRVRNRNLDDVDVGPMDGDEEEDKHGVNSSGGGQKPGLGSGLEDHDVIVISRREIVATLLAAASIATFLLAVQRSNAIRRWSLAAFRGVLEERFPPSANSSVALARFMMEGMRHGPAADLRLLKWVNTAQPRLMEDVVAQMKKELSGAVATISVHCAKFDQESDLATIRHASEELRLRHVVAADTDLRLWKSVGAEQWPTILILSPNEHRVLVALTGKDLTRFEECTYASLSLYSNAKLQTSSFPLPIVAKSNPLDAVLLQHPSKIALDENGGRLFVSDSGNSRILVTTLEGKFLSQIGGVPQTDPLEMEGKRHILYNEGGNDGFRDGSFEEALFNNPQGLAYNPITNELAVADAGNNCLRLANFEKKTVRSVLFKNPTKTDNDKSQGTNSRLRTPYKPWDVAVSAGNIFISVAGSHTIWRLDPFGDFILFCGTAGVAGHSDVDTGYRGATFASPTGLCCTKESIFITDSDSSTIREVGLVNKSVRTVIGGDPIFLGNLSVFGDRDGYGSSARLQRPMGICRFPDDKLLVADCYNNKIRLVTPEDNECRLFCGTGTPGYRDGSRESARFSSPTGIAYHRKLQVAFVADKNNNCIRIIDGITGSVSTMKFFGFPDFGELPQRSELPPSD